jgi:anthranilate synthase component I
MIFPAFDQFKRLARQYSLVPVSLELLADELTPLALFHARYRESATSFLLESVEGGEHLGRYSFAGFDAHRIIRSRGKVLYSRNGRREEQWPSPNPLDEVRRLLKAYRAPDVPGLPRFYGGAVGYVSYDMVRNFETLPDVGVDELGLPDCFFLLTRDMYVFDHLAHTLRIVRCVPIEKGKSLRALYRDAEKALARLARGIRLRPFAARSFPAAARELPPVDPAEKRNFLRMVKRAKEYIAAGDIIQAVLSRRMSFPATSEPLEIYRALRRINPSPYMYFLRDGENHVIGSSPEMLVRLEDGRAETRPIAGTRPRGKNEAEDARLAADLLKDEKERAEHLMLVDLGRNDLGRVCRAGSVEVPHFMRVERYSHVMHLVSEITGRLAPSQDAFDLFRACFPAGTLSGAPKVRAMEIIEELEKSRRGLYGGSVGYFSYTGNMDMAITIRTLLLKKGRAYLQAGAGIVADSVPEAEFQESQNKAAAVLAALRAAEAR